MRTASGNGEGLEGGFRRSSGAHDEEEEEEEAGGCGTSISRACHRDKGWDSARGGRGEAENGGERRGEERRGEGNDRLGEDFANESFGGLNLALCAFEESRSVDNHRIIFTRVGSNDTNPRGTQSHCGRPRCG